MAKTILDFGNVIAITDGATIENYISKPFNYYIDVNDQLTVVSADGRKLSLAAGDFAAYADNDAIITALNGLGPLQPADVAEVVQGKRFGGGTSGNGIADGADFDILLTTGVNAPRVRIEILAPANWLYTLYVATTTSADGTTVTVADANFVTGNVATTKLYHTPTLTFVGVATMNRLTFVGQNDLKMTDSDLILPASSKFLLRLTNNTGGVSTAGASFKIVE